MTLKNVESKQAITPRHLNPDALPSVKFRSPTAHDGYAVTALIKNSPPLDNNSAYCNLLQCSHFAETCVIAESNDGVIGWMSAYIPPNQRDYIFVWQVAVHPDTRGQGLAKRMLYALLKRNALLGVRFLITTITQDNQASWGVFESFAKSHQLKLTKSPHFEKEKHFQGVHDTEFLVEIGPFEIQAVINNQGGQHD